MERPEPDGYVRIYFKSGVDYDFGSTMKVMFSSITRGWHDHSDGLVFLFEGKRTHIPKTSIGYYDVHMNSDEYRAKLHEFQKQHDHTWIPQEYDTMFGHITSEVDFYCGDSKTGEPGCGATKKEGVEQYA